MTELKRTLQYFLMVVHSLWRENWGKTVKALLLLLSTIFIIDCLIFIGFFGGFPDFVTQLINDFSAELRTGLTRLAFALLAFGLLFPFLFVYEAAKIYERQETDKRKLNSKVKSLQKSQKEKDELRYYDEVEVSYHPLAETLEEKRAGYREHRATETRRLSYFIENKGEVTIKDCRIKMTDLLLKESPHNYYEDTTNLPIEHNAIKWNNSFDERINLSRCSEFLSYCVGLGLSLRNKETQSGGTFQTDIPCLQLVA